MKTKKGEAKRVILAIRRTHPEEGTVILAKAVRRPRTISQHATLRRVRISLGQ
jgi:hypothetical protein